MPQQELLTSCYLCYDRFIKFTTVFFGCLLSKISLDKDLLEKEIFFYLPEYTFILPSILKLFSLGIDFLLVLLSPGTLKILLCCPSVSIAAFEKSVLV